MKNYFTPLLAVVFITLKLVGVITWSWWCLLGLLGFAVVFVTAVFLTVILAILRKRG